jgi:hypothetical protein
MVETAVEVEVQQMARRERIAARAYEISQSEDAGSDLENWLRAERELGDDLGDEQ